MAMSHLRRLGDLWLGTEYAQRLRLRQTSLAMLLMGISVIALHYAVHIDQGRRGPLRGACFPVLTLILMFGMFQLRARSAYSLALFALVVFGAVMVVMSRQRPAVYPPEFEVIHFLVLACMLPAVAVLTARLSRIRHRLAQQREELARARAQLQTIAHATS